MSMVLRRPTMGTMGTVVMIEDVAMDVERLNQAWWDMSQLEGDDLATRKQLENTPAIDPNKVFPFGKESNNAVDTE